MKHSIGVLFLGALVGAFGAQTSVPDSIAAELSAEKARFETSKKSARDALLQELDVSSDSPDSARAIADRDAFERAGLLPATRPDAAAKYEAVVLKATARLWRALEAAEEAFSDAALHERAALVRKEKEAFRSVYEQSRWTDVRAQARLDDADGLHWSGSSIVFGGESDSVLTLRMPPLPDGAGYRARLVVERVSGSGGLKLLFPRADLDDHGLGLYVLGGFGGRTSGLEQVDGASADSNRSTRVADVFRPGSVTHLEMESTPARIRVLVNDKSLLDWDDSDSLTLAPSVSRQFKRDRRSMLLVVPQGTVLRLDAASVLQIPALEKEPVARERVAKASAPDRLPYGRKFVGTWFGGNYFDAEVVERDRGGKTAALRLRGERLAWFRATLKTDDDGSTFKIEDIRNTKPAASGGPMITINFENGTGRVTSSGTLTMRWSASSDRPGSHHDWSTTASGKRQ